ncbi:MAG: aminotransferase class V-fold PLP-dependent enzyme, partial [Alphaproteobacteria bacterium]|nr:aminotransferase class V-fold PLP-dependent enzyme [Alphaproteobacteria bacterium]
MTYLDHNATTPLKPQAAARMAHMAGLWGNASSVHRYGREVRQHMMAARHTLSGAVGATPAGIVFCSGATEALHLALAQCAPTQVAYTAIEHDAVRAAAGTQATVIPATPDGVVHLIALEKILQQGSIKLVACMLANNETGVLQPVADVAALAKKYGAMVVVDAVQAVG